jgi:hypothetical protein
VRDDGTVLGLSPPAPALAPALDGAGDGDGLGMDSTIDTGSESGGGDVVVTDSAPSTDADVNSNEYSSFDSNADTGLYSDADSGIDPCATCAAIGQSCTLATDCQNAIGSTCLDGVCTLSQTCAGIQSVNLAALDGVYTVDVDGPTGAVSPGDPGRNVRDERRDVLGVGGHRRGGRVLPRFALTRRAAG